GRLPSDRHASVEISKANSAGPTPNQLTFLSSDCGTPRWSVSGREIIFSAQPQGNGDLFVISADGGQPRQLPTDSSDETAPNDSRDGQWIYFASDRGDSWNIWKMPAESGPASQVPGNGGIFVPESPDGQS